MTKIKKIFLWTLFCLIANHANAVDHEEMQYVNDGIVQFDCDAQTSSFYFNADASQSVFVQAKKYKVDTSSLLISGPEDLYGVSLRLGSKKAIRQCGAIQIVFESGFYHSNPLGQLGLMDYPLMSISINGKSLFGKAVLNLCASGGVRMTCPTNFSIQSIEISKTSQHTYQVKLTKAFPENEGEGFVLKKEFLKFNIK